MLLEKAGAEGTRGNTDDDRVTLGPLVVEQVSGHYQRENLQLPNDAPGLIGVVSRGGKANTR